MANPQPEPFVKFSKELFDALLLSSMPPGYKEMVLAVIRRTYGEHGNKTAPISYSLLRRITGRADSGIRRTVGALEREGVLVKDAEPTFRTPALWRLNKDYETWGVWSVQSATVVAEGTNQAECAVVAERSATTVAERSATTVAPLKNIEHRRGGAPASGDPPVDNSPEEPDDFRDIDFGEEPSGGPPEAERSPAQQLVAFYVDEHKRVCGSEPTDRQKGIAADLVGKKLRKGSKPENVRTAIRCMVAKGKGPSTLPAFVDEAEVAARGQPGPGPPLPTMTDEEKRKSWEVFAKSEEGRKVSELTKGIGRPL